MFALIHKLILLLSPERAHSTAIFFLKLFQWWKFKCMRSTLPAAGIAIRFSSFRGLQFRARLGCAAGFDKNAEVFAALAGLGFAFIEVGTVTPKSQAGNPKPRLWRRLPDALVNHLGFNNVGLERFCQNILSYRKYIEGVPLMANIGKNFDTPIEQALSDYKRGFERLKDCVDAVVINLSSPNTPNLTSLQNAEFLERLAGILPSDFPALIKLSPDLSNDELAKLCAQINENARFAGVVLTNSSRRLAERSGFSSGGMSGTPLFDRALECVAIGREKVKSPKIIIGVGGISNTLQARAMRRAGADLLEVYTAFIYRGPRLIAEINRALG